MVGMQLQEHMNIIKRFIRLNILQDILIRHMDIQQVWGQLRLIIIKELKRIFIQLIRRKRFKILQRDQHILGF